VSSKDLTIRIKAEDQASQQLQQIGRQFEGIGQTLRDVGKIAAGVLIRDFANNIATGINEAMELGGQLQTLSLSFERMKEAAGASGLTLESLREATKGTVSDVDLLTAANQALALGLPTEDLEELFAAAMKLGHAMGIDTKKAVESLTLGLGRQSKLILDNLGIVFQAEEAYEWYAASIGKTAKQLTDAEKKTAWQTYAIEKLREKAAELGDSISETQLAQERWNAQMENFKAGIGAALGPLAGFFSALAPIQPLLSSLATAVIPMLITKITTLGGILPAIKAGFAALNAVMAANPILLVVTAIAALVGILAAAYATCEPFRNAVNELGRAIWNFLKPAIDAIVNGLRWLWDNILGPLAAFIAAVLVVQFKMWGMVLEWLWNNILKPLADFLGSTLKPVLDAIGGAISAVTGAFSWLGEQIGHAMNAVADAVSGGGEKVVENWEDACSQVEKIQETSNNVIIGLMAELFGVQKQLQQSFIDEQIRILEEGYERQKQIYEQELNEQLGALQQNLDAQLAEIEKARQEALEIEEQRYREATDAAIQFWLDQLKETVEGWDKVIQEYTQHYDRLIQEATRAYEEQRRETENFYNEQINTVQRRLNEQLRLIEENYREQTNTVRTEYDEQIAATREFYDSMIAEINAGLQAIRDARNEDLMNLEYNYLLQKQLLEKQYSEGVLSEEQYQEKLNELNRQYREERARISDEYRLQELEYELQHKDELEALEEEKNAKITELEQKKNEELLNLEEQKNAAVSEAEQTAKAEIEALTEEKNSRLLELENAHAEEVAAIEQEKNNKLAEIQANREQLETEHQQNVASIEEEYARQRQEALAKFEQEKQALIADYEAKIAELTEEYQNKLAEIQRKGAEEQIGILEGFCSSVSSMFSGLWSSIVSGAQSAWSSVTSTISGAVSSAGDALSGFTSAVSGAMSSAGSAISGFISSICFAHAIHEAVESSIKDLNVWVKKIDDSMREGTRAVKEFVGDVGAPKGGFGVSVTPSGPVTSVINVTISSPLVHVEGSADKRTAELAAELIEKKLRNVIVEASSSGAPATHKRIRLARVI